MHSQYNEDDIFIPLLKDVKTKHVLDIGAWNSTTFSNSRGLIDLGWSGVLIEPSPGPLHSLVKDYGTNDRVKIIGAAVTVHGGLVELAITDDAVSQPAECARLSEWAATGGFFGKLTVPSLSVADLFNQFGGDFEMVSIDTEGSSVDVFAEMIRVGPRPRCVMLEHDGRFVEIAGIAEAAHYRQVHLNGTNVLLRWSGGRE